MPTVVTFKWYGPQVHKAILEALTPRLKKVGELLAKEIKSAISVPYPPASAPDDPPRKRSGALWAAVGYRMTSPQSVRVGVFDRGAQEAYWAAFLETGTSRMAARPFIRPTFMRLAKRIADIIGAPLSAQGIVRIER